MSIEHSPIRQVGGGNAQLIGRMLLTDAELAQLLGCSRSTVWRRVADGLLPRPVRLGGLSRFLISEVEDMIEKAAAERDATEAA